jgi:hypothetical protein
VKEVTTYANVTQATEHEELFRVLRNVDIRGSLKQAFAKMLSPSGRVPRDPNGGLRRIECRTNRKENPFVPVEKSQIRNSGERGWLIPNGKKPPMLAGLPERQSLVDLFHEFSTSTAEFLQYDNGYRSWKYTYAQLGRAAHQFALRLVEHNISKGNKVIFWSDNRPEWIAAFWGCLLAGIIVVPIDYRTSVRFLRHV